MTNTDEWSPQPCTLVGVTHEWTGDRFDRARGGLDLLLHLDRMLDDRELEVLSTHLRDEGIPLANVAEHRVRSVDPNAVERIVDTIRTLVANLPDEVVQVQRRNAYNEQAIIQAIERGLGQAPPQ